MDNPLSRDLDHILEHTEHLWADARGERFFLTGGTGFVGTWLVESLLWANRRLALGIRAVVLSRKPWEFEHRSPHLVRDFALTEWRGECASFEDPPGNFAFLIHAASEGYASTVGRAMAGALRVLEFSRAHLVKRLLFTSSGAVPAGFISPYANGKRISEALVSCYSQKYGFDALVARLYAFIGPGLPLDQHYAAGNFIRDALKGGPIRVQGDGTPYRSYLYAADLAIWLWTMLFRGKAGQPYNVGSDQELSIEDLALGIALATPNFALVRIAKTPGTGEPERYVPDITRAQSELDLQVWIPLDEAIRRTLAWHRGQNAGR